MSQFPSHLFSWVSRASLAAAFAVALGCASRHGTSAHDAGDFHGAWALADTEGDLFDVIVNEDGSAVTNWSKGAAGARGERGEWSIAPDGSAITLSYDSGWRDVIARADGGFSKKSYGPGVPLSAAPSNTGLALRVRGPLRPFVGVWQMAAEGNGAPFFVALKSDGSARKTVNPNATGAWSVADGVARVEWSDGWRLAIRENGRDRSFVQEEWHPKAPASGEPTSRLACRPVGGVPAAPPGE